MTSKRIFTLVNLWIVTSGAVLAVGCGGTYDSSVHGTVSLDGSNLTSGIVAFYPTTGGPTAYAYIGADGEYVVRTGREEGLPSGEYGISVTANEAPTSATRADGGPPPPGKMITPVWYRSKDTSGLSRTVESGDNEINLELTSQPPAGWNPRRG
jgi:hypothetical protein